MDLAKRLVRMIIYDTGGVLVCSSLSKRSSAHGNEPGSHTVPVRVDTQTNTCTDSTHRFSETKSPELDVGEFAESVFVEVDVEAREVIKLKVIPD